MLLADMGADVIRVDRSPPGGVTAMEQTAARGKRSVALNLKDPQGLVAALKLASAADVVLDGMRPGAMERLGLGPADVHAANPRVVYARLTGWGQTGPLAQRAGHDLNYIAMSGVLGALGRADAPPTIPINLLGDFAGGSLFCALGIVAALLERERSGKGQVIDAAMIDGAASLMSFFKTTMTDGSWRERGKNLLDGGVHFYNVYETSDKKWMSVGPLEPQFYAELLDALDLPAELASQQYDPSHDDEMRTKLETIFKSKTRDEWEEIFIGRDACVFPILDPREAAMHSANAPRRTHDEPAPRFDRTKSVASDSSPAPGEHTREVLTEAGLSSGEIAELVESGIAFDNTPAQG